MKDQVIYEALSEAKQSARLSLRSEITNFMGNYRSAEDEKEIAELLKCFCQLRAWMSVKQHFLQSYFDYFPKNYKDLNEDIHNMIERFHG